MASRVGRNERCTCGSGKKYKHCCARKGSALAARQASRSEVELALEGAKELLAAKAVAPAMAALQRLLAEDPRFAELRYAPDVWERFVLEHASTIVAEVEKADEQPAAERLWNRLGRQLDTGPWRARARNVLRRLMREAGFTPDDRRAVALATVWIDLARGKDAWKDNIPASLVFEHQLVNELSAVDAIAKAYDAAPPEERFHLVARSPLAMALIVRDGSSRHSEAFACLAGEHPPPLLTGPECFAAAVGKAIAARAPLDKRSSAEHVELLWRLAPALDRVDELLAAVQADEGSPEGWELALRAFSVDPDAALALLGSNPAALDALPGDEAQQVRGAIAALPGDAGARRYGAWLLEQGRREHAELVAELVAELADLAPTPVVKVGKRG